MVRDCSLTWSRSLRSVHVFLPGQVEFSHIVRWVAQFSDAFVDTRRKLLATVHALCITVSFHTGVVQARCKSFTRAETQVGCHHCAKLSKTLWFGGLPRLDFRDIAAFGR